MNTNTAAADEEDEEEIILRVVYQEGEKMIFCDEGTKTTVFLIMSLILYTTCRIINNFYRGETMEKKKLILLLPLSLAFFSLCRDKATPLFFFFFFLLLMYVYV